MLRHRRPPVLWSTVEAPMTAALVGLKRGSSGCLTRSPVLELWHTLFRERARPFPGVLRLVDERGDRRVEAQHILRVLVQPAPGHLIGDTDRQRPFYGYLLLHLYGRSLQRRMLNAASDSHYI